MEEKEDGIFVQWIDNSPEAIRRRDLVQRANRLEEQQASEEKEILQQVERARQNKAVSTEPEKPAELAKEKWTDFSLNLKSSSNSPKPTTSTSQGKNNEQQDASSKPVDKPVKKPNVFGLKRKQPSGTKAVPDPPKKMTEIERIMKEDMERKKRRLVK